MGGFEPGFDSGPMGSLDMDMGGETFEAPTGPEETGGSEPSITPEA